MFGTELLLEEKFSKIECIMKWQINQMMDRRRRFFSTYLLQELMLILNWL
jgi:hypothetical protein